VRRPLRELLLHVDCGAAKAIFGLSAHIWASKPATLGKSPEAHIRDVSFAVLLVAARPWV
jgi:hypothetical protein